MLGLIAFSKDGFKIAKAISNYFYSCIHYFGKEDISDCYKISKNGKNLEKDKGKSRVDLSNIYIESDGIVKSFGKIYNKCSGIIFISACGIAVRVISPYVKDKKIDAPVVVIDDGCRYCIPILSGHEGGANRLALNISAKLGIEAVVTTGTESKKNVIVGIGLRKGVDSEEIEEAVATVLSNNDISINNVRVLASIDLKMEESGLVEYARKINIPLRFIESEKIKKVENNRVFSPFVKEKIGVGGVCENAAMLAGVRTEIIIPKTIFKKKVTIAAAREKYLWEVLDRGEKNT